MNAMPPRSLLRQSRTFLAAVKRFAANPVEKYLPRPRFISPEARSAFRLVAGLAAQLLKPVSCSLICVRQPEFLRYIEQAVWLTAFQAVGDGWNVFGKHIHHLVHKLNGLLAARNASR